MWWRKTDRFHLHFLRRVVERVQYETVHVRGELFGVLFGEEANLVLAVDRAGHEDKELQFVRLERFTNLLVDIPQFALVKLMDSLDNFFFLKNKIFVRPIFTF